MSSTYDSGYLAKYIGGECSDQNILVSNFASLSLAKSDSISFYYDQKYKDDLVKTKAGLVILKKTDSRFRKGPCIFSDNPYLAFAKILSLFKQDGKSFYISKNSFVSSNASLGENISIGAYSSIGNNTVLNDNVYIGSNTSLGDNVKIGLNTIIHSNVSIESNVQICRNCEIYSGARIGTAGFGYAKDKDGSWLKIPQVGTVIIGDNVDIGANTTIDRGALENTYIHDGVKIDNLVQIGHNCIIGKNSIIAGCAGIAGSAKIGKNCMIGGAAMIKGHITIADDTIISGATGMGKNVDEPGKRFTNIFPYNIEHKEWLRIANNLKKMGKKND